jgi:hypothetical protein
MSIEAIDRQKLKELRSILKSARSIRYRLIRLGDYERFKNDVLEFEERLMNKIDEIEFYIELEKQLREDE